MYKRVTFANRLKTLRMERHLSYAGLAKKLGVSSVSLGYYEREERVPDIEVMYHICRYFNVTSDYLIGLTDNRTPEAAAIGDATGLSDLAIDSLQRHKNKGELDNTIDVINFIIEHNTPGPKPQEPLYQIGYDRTAQDRSDGIQETLHKYGRDKELYDNEMAEWEKRRIPLLEFIANYLSLNVTNKKMYVSKSGLLTELSPHYLKTENTENVDDLFIQDEVSARDLYETWQKNKILEQLQKLKEEYIKSKE